MNKINTETTRVSSTSIEYLDIVTPGTFEEAVRVSKEIHASVTQHAVHGYWLIGKMVHDMQENEGAYGTGITARLSEEMSASGEPVSKRIIEECHRTFKRCPDIKSLRTLTDKGLGWSQVRSINSIGDNKLRNKVVDHVADKNLNARQTDAYVRGVLDTDSGIPSDKAPELPANHPTAFFQKVLEGVRKLEGKIDRSEKEILDSASLLKALVSGIAPAVLGCEDDVLVSEEQFSLAVDACSEVSSLSTMLLDRLKLYREQQLDIFAGIENLLTQSFVTINKEVHFEDEEGS